MVKVQGFHTYHSTIKNMDPFVLQLVWTIQHLNICAHALIKVFVRLYGVSETGHYPMLFIIMITIVHIFAIKVVDDTTGAPIVGAFIQQQI